MPDATDDRPEGARKSARVFKLFALLFLLLAIGWAIYSTVGGSGSSAKARPGTKNGELVITVGTEFYYPVPVPRNRVNIYVPSAPIILKTDGADARGYKLIPDATDKGKVRIEYWPQGGEALCIQDSPRHYLKAESGTVEVILIETATTGVRCVE